MKIRMLYRPPCQGILVVYIQRRDASDEYKEHLATFKRFGYIQTWQGHHVQPRERGEQKTEMHTCFNSCMISRNAWRSSLPAEKSQPETGKISPEISPSL